jgi:hypothetical protein
MIFLAVMIDFVLGDEVVLYTAHSFVQNIDFTNILYHQCQTTETQC